MSSTDSTYIILVRIKTSFAILLFIFYNVNNLATLVGRTQAGHPTTRKTRTVMGKLCKKQRRSFRERKNSLGEWFEEYPGVALCLPPLLICLVVSIIMYVDDGETAPLYITLAGTAVPTWYWLKDKYNLG
jgi:hypothetical protein